MSDFNFQVKEDGDVIAQFVKEIDADVFIDVMQNIHWIILSKEPINEQ